MAGYVRQLECLNCSESRSFVQHLESEQRLLSQADAQRLGRSAVLTCGRCGGTNIISGWSDAAPYAASGIMRRRRTRRPYPDL